MSNIDRKKVRCTNIRLEALEFRELLSTVALPGHRVAEVSPFARVKKQVIKTTLTGQGAISMSSRSQGTTYFDTIGTTSLLGSSTFNGHVSHSASRTGSIKYNNGVATLADLGGHAIDVSLAGSGKNTADLPFSLKGAITGGAGKYAGAAGSISGKGPSTLQPTPSRSSSP